MPTITINRKVVDKIIGKKLPDSKLKSRIAMLGTDLESVTKDEIVVEVFPNRPDMLSEQGFARALGSFIGTKTGPRKYKVKPSSHKVIIHKSMKSVRPYTACAIVKNLKLDDQKIKELIEIQEKLHITFCRNRKKAAMGIYPLEKIKPPIKFTSRKPKDIVFRPLEWPTELNANQILQKHPTGREYAHLVEGLTKYAIFIDSRKQILSFTPIINSHLTGKISERTREAFIEISGFDFNTCEMVLNIIVTTLADMGADIYSMKLVYPDKTIVTPNLKPKQMKLDLNYVNKRLGLKLNQAQLKKLLARMGFGYSNNKVLVPAYRADILHSVDFVEDIAIAYGFENFEPAIPQVATIADEDEFYKFTVKVARILVGLGLLEASTYHLTNKDNQNKNTGLNLNLIEVLDPKSKEYNVLRAWIIPNLLQVLKDNKHHEYPQKLFELGAVFKKNPKTETRVEEPIRLAILTCHKDADYTEIRQFMDHLFSSLGINYKIKDTEHNSFISGRVGRVIVKGKKVAYIGEILPQVLRNFELEMPVAALELNLTEVFSIMDKC